MDDMAEGMAGIVMFLIFAAACASLGVGAAVGSLLVGRTSLLGRPIPRLNMVRIPLVMIAASLIAFVVFLVTSVIPAYALSIPFVLFALIASIYRVIKWRPWRITSVLLAIVGILLMTAPAVYLEVSLRLDTARDERVQKMKVLDSPLKAIFVPDVSELPPGTKVELIYADAADSISDLTTAYKLDLQPKETNGRAISSPPFVYVEHSATGADTLLNNCSQDIGDPYSNDDSDVSCKVITTTQKGRELHAYGYSTKPLTPRDQNEYFVPTGQDAFLRISIDDELRETPAGRSFDVVRFTDALTPISKREFVTRANGKFTAVFEDN